MKINWGSKHFWFVLTSLNKYLKLVSFHKFGKNDILEGKLLVLPSRERRKVAPF